MERIRKVAPPNVEVMYVTMAGDVWGTTRQTPDQMAKHLENYYVARKGFGLPITIWIGPRRSDIDGGSQHQPCPTFESYPLRGVPWFIVTDGKGRARYIQIGFSESLLTSTMQYLVGEAAQAQQPAAPAGVRTTSGTQ